MADSDSTVLPCSPQPEVQEILREVEEVARECSIYLFPRRRFRCHAKTSAERKLITEARIQLYERSQGQCELRVSPKCWGGITWNTMHTAHVVSRARLGTWDLENLKAGCPECHIGWEHNGGKPCPPKVR